MIGSLIGATVSCLWQAVLVAADVIVHGAGMVGSMGT